MQSVTQDGNLVLPERVRLELVDDLVLTRGFDRNLLLFPVGTWKGLVEKILAQPISNSSVRLFRRRFFSGAIELSADANGQFSIPSQLREFAGISGEVVIAGMIDHLELWSAKEWAPALSAALGDNNRERWSDLGI